MILTYCTQKKGQLWSNNNKRTFRRVVFKKYFCESVYLDITKSWGIWYSLPALMQKKMVTRHPIVTKDTIVADKNNKNFTTITAATTWFPSDMSPTCHNCSRSDSTMTRSQVIKIISRITILWVASWRPLSIPTCISSWQPFLATIPAFFYPYTHFLAHYAFLVCIIIGLNTILAITFYEKSKCFVFPWGIR